MDIDVNPLLAPWDGPFGLPPFGRILPRHFRSAFERTMAEHRDELVCIASQAAAPGFDNTVAAFDAAGRRLARVEAVFYNLTASVTDEALQAVQREMAAPLAAHWSAVFMHAGLFERVESLHARRDELGLGVEQQ